MSDVNCDVTSTTSVGNDFKMAAPSTVYVCGKVIMLETRKRTNR